MGLIYVKVNPSRMARILTSGEFFLRDWNCAQKSSNLLLVNPHLSQLELELYIALIPQIDSVCLCNLVSSLEALQLSISSSIFIFTIPCFVIILNIRLTECRDVSLKTLLTKAQLWRKKIKQKLAVCVHIVCACTWVVAVCAEIQKG